MMNHFASKLNFPIISTSPLQSQCCRGSPLAPSLHILPWLSLRFTAHIIIQNLIILFFVMIYHHNRHLHQQHALLAYSARLSLRFRSSFVLFSSSPPSSFLLSP